MAKGNCTAVHVKLVRIRPNRLEPSKRYWREGLVDLVQIDVLNRQAGALEPAPRVAVIGSSSMMTGSPAVTVRPTMRAIGLIL